MQTVEEVIADIEESARPKDDGKKPNTRFSKKKFESLMRAMLNDTGLTAKYAVVKNGELKDIKEVLVTQKFRRFLKHVLEQAGFDKKESEIVMGPDFRIESVDGLYEFIDAAIFTYINAGSRFEFREREGFRGSIRLIATSRSTVKRTVNNPQTGESLGKFEFTNKPYQKLVASSPCPEYLKTRKRV